MRGEVRGMKVLSLRPYLNTLSPEAEMRVTRSLDRTSRGFDRDLVTPLIPDRSDPMTGRIARIDEVASFLYPTGYSWLDEIELERQEKIGPYSIMLPYFERRSQVYSYFEHPDIRIDRAALDYASEKVARLIPRQLRATSVENAFAEMPRGTNLGAPVFSADLKEYGAVVLELAREAIRSDFNLEVPPCILYWRGQPKGLTETPKQRTVWGFSHWVTILELMLQTPMLHALRRDMSFCAWVSQPKVNEAVTVVLDEAENDVLSVDFSGFDASVHQILIHRVFDIIRVWFSTREESLINFVEKSFLSTGLITPEGILTDRAGGVPSGSGVTNLVDSLVQLLAFHYFAYITHNAIDMGLVQGDDGVFSFRRPWRLENVHEVLESIGLNVSSDKGGVSRDMVLFLQNVHHKGYRQDGYAVGIRPVMKVLNGMLSYERFHKRWNSYDDSIRWRQQLSSASYHPAFPKFVRWLFDNDRYSCLSLSRLVKEAGGKEMVESALEMKAFPYGKPSLAELKTGPVEALLHQFCNGDKHLTARG